MEECLDMAAMSDGRVAPPRVIRRLRTLDAVPMP